jgi:hypothetical protein
MKKIVYLLMTTEKYLERQTNILSTWGKDIDLYFYSEHEDNENKVIKVCDENNVEVKQVSIFKKIKELLHNEYEWYFFGDDDTFVNTEKLNLELDLLDKDIIYGQDIFGCYGDLHYPSGGAGFLVSNKIIENFFDSKIYNVGYGDVTFGLNIRDKGLSFKNHSGFFSQNPSHYGINDIDCYNHITFHYIKSISQLTNMNNACKFKK